MEFLPARRNAVPADFSICASRAVSPRAPMVRIRGASRGGCGTAERLTIDATSAAALSRRLLRFVIANYAETCGGPWLRQIYEGPLPHVAALLIVHRCRGAARRDVTALGVPRSATVLFFAASPRQRKFDPMA